MKLEYGKIVKNKTKDFLFPALKGHGEVFLNKLSDVYKLAYGISDMILEGSSVLEERRPFFILCDKAVNTKKFENFLEWLKYQKYYIADYPADEDYINPRHHMVVIDMPQKYYNAYDKFLVGLYSEMYERPDVDFFFRNDKDSIAYKILTKDPTYRDVFLDKVENLFGVPVKDTPEFKNSELEFPYSLEKEQEIFNI